MGFLCAYVISAAVAVGADVGLMGSVEEAPWREPGQVVSPTYLQNGTLRYAAEGREIVGRNGSYFNNRPLYCEPNAEGVVLAGDLPLVSPCRQAVCVRSILRGNCSR